MKQYKLINDKLVSEDSTYSLSKEMKEWCEKNPKDSYPESDFKLKKVRLIRGVSYTTESHSEIQQATKDEYGYFYLVAVPATDEKEMRISNWQMAKNIFLKGIDKNKTLPDWAKQELKDLVTEQCRSLGKIIGTFELLFLRKTQ